MAGLLDLLMQARESGRGARADLENSINYYIPPELRGLLGLAAEANPVVSMERAGQDAQQLFAPDQALMDRMAAAGDMASNMAGVLAPMAAGRAVGMPAVRALEEGLLGMSMTPEATALRQFAVRDDGGFTLYQGSPHNFAAERLVRMPDGSTQYVVGAPDVLPDVPAGAEVLRDFPLGRQRMDKIGTGEGAQAYGHGLYGAENEGVATGYRDALSSGWQFNSREPLNAAGLTGRDLDVASQMLSTSHSGDAAAADWENWLGKTLTPEQRLAFSDAFSRKGGSMYELNINADPADFLDSDLPLSKQPQKVRDALQPVIAGMKDARMNELDRKAILSGKASGADLYNALKHSTPGDSAFDRAAAATDAIRSRGIPGIRYLDAGSRSTGGTSNYVIFDENLIDIVRKYGIAGAAAMLGASQADVAQAMQQQRPQGLLSGPQ